MPGRGSDVYRAVKRGARWALAQQPLNAAVTFPIKTLVRLGMRPRLTRYVPKRGLVRCRLPNGRTLVLWTKGDDRLTDQVFWRGWSGYEPETSGTFFRLARDASVVMDIGAHVGFYALLAAHANPDGIVYAFEPFPAVRDRLLRNVGLNGVHVRCVPAALADSEGLATLHVDMSQTMSSEATTAPLGMRPGSVAIDVVTTTADDFVDRERVAAVHLVKIDTETTEPQVLRGMQRTLARWRPTIVCEVLCGLGTEAGLEAALRPHGYRFYLLTPDGPLEQATIRGNQKWPNYLFSTMSPAELRVRLG